MFFEKLVKKWRKYREEIFEKKTSKKVCQIKKE
jgi:hypothetical protein